MNVSPLIEILRSARANRRISQLNLAMSLGVSQRHVSFVESGRAKPSRGLLLAWLTELETPLEQRNAALLGAGYAPAYRNAALGDASLGPAIEALELLISAHDPQPAFVLDAHWNLIDSNAGAKRLASLLMAGPTSGGPPPAGPITGTTIGLGRGPVNMLDALAAPGGFSRRIKNLDEVGPALLARLRREARVIRELAPRVQSIEDMLKAALGTERLHNAEEAARAPLLTTHFDTPLGPLGFFSMFTTFGTPQDITLASLRVELLFAADQATAAIWKGSAADAGFSDGHDQPGS